MLGEKEIYVKTRIITEHIKDGYYSCSCQTDPRFRIDVKVSFLKNDNYHIEIIKASKKSQFHISSVQNTDVNELAKEILFN